MKIQSTKHVLLLGAGFTKNFGGLLADKMWYEIFNHEEIQSQPKIKKLMMNNFDYEEIYYSVLKESRDEEGKLLPSEFTDEEKAAIKVATKSAYIHIDENLRRHIIDHPRPTHLHNVNNLIFNIRSQRQDYKFVKDGKTYRFSPDPKNKSFIFTLNQDLFFERLYPNNANAELSIPGINNDPDWFTTNFNKPLEPSDYRILPTEDELKLIKDSLLELGGYFLIKLHGSCNWISSNGSDMDMMVIGKSKTEQIQNEPLLKHYFEIFEEVLSQDQCRLLIIGYGFGDKHINSIISKAVTDHELKIYILSTLSQKELKKKLTGSESSQDTVIIWEGISGMSTKVKEILVDTDYNLFENEHFYDTFFAKDYKHSYSM
ncbi:hypothetical protein MSMAT_2749 [Methanosarcina mazei TMA]|uniref:SIR2 family protein n=1 Tax=Methanosarcina mazei TaxID=2209 RepID=UPI001C33AB84|nr:SIR2 family protein [Methanosarcina mazei]UWJ24006.1 hypothetical protein MSMAT_2749 [Methanosarcina mazei TMA]BBL64765.1 hypothetical protein MmazTMA_17420 [Methanosarcina mazei]